MNIGAVYSHLNGVEFLMVHQPDLWGEVRDVISSVDAEACRTKEADAVTIAKALDKSEKTINTHRDKALAALRAAILGDEQ